MTDYFFKFFYSMITKYTLKPSMKSIYHRASTLSKSEVMLIIVQMLEYKYFVEIIYGKLVGDKEYIDKNLIAYFRCLFPLHFYFFSLG